MCSQTRSAASACGLCRPLRIPAVPSSSGTTSSHRVPACPPSTSTRLNKSFEVLAGTARVRRGRDTFDLQQGESVVIPASTGHGLRNQTGDEVTGAVPAAPGDADSRLLRDCLRAGAQGKVSRRGVPSPVRGAVILAELGQRDYLPAVPIVVQQGLLVALAWIGRRLGVRARPTA